MKQEFIENVHYYIHEGKVIMTEKYHLERGFCCGNNCKHCPYEPKSVKGNKVQKVLKSDDVRK